MNSLQIKIKTKIGPLYLVASSRGLQKIIWTEQDCPYSQKKDQSASASKYLKLTQQEIEEYLDGKRQKFSIPLDIHGTSFQKKVWAQLQKIPYGQTWSYKQLAESLKMPKACRAVGTANGRNPLSLIIPCHRVIASDGSLGGYAGGLKIKEMLLAAEKSYKT